MKNQHFNFVALLGGVIFSSCSPMEFTPMQMPIPPENNPPAIVDIPSTKLLSSVHFPIQNSKITLNQESLESNKTSLTFIATKPDGTHINDLLAKDFDLFENGNLISQYDLDSNYEAIRQGVDIVFAVDVTGSMAPTIESAKSRLINFINTTRQQGYHTRMCLVTFGDYTLQKCNRFYNNNPQDPQTLSEVEELKSEILKLRALMGINDPGGSDFNENPMRALIDASKAPWSSDNQRFVILITDDGFLYSPGNQGNVGVLAPHFSEVKTAIEQSHIRVFAVTPSLPGYNQDFKFRENFSTKTFPSIVSLSQGEHFLFSDLIAGKITIDTVLNQIIQNVKTTYHITFIADKNPGLKPTLPIQAREHKIKIKNQPESNVQILQKWTNLPNGRPEYQNKWSLSNKEIDPKSVKVKINNEPANSGFIISGYDLIFDRPPLPNSEIHVEFEFLNLIDSLLYRPIILPTHIQISSLSIFINGLKARSSDLLFQKNIEGEWLIHLNPEILTTDKFEIKKLKGASIQIYETQSQTTK